MSLGSFSVTDRPEYQRRTKRGHLHVHRCDSLTQLGRTTWADSYDWIGLWRIDQGLMAIGRVIARSYNFQRFLPCDTFDILVYDVAPDSPFLPGQRLYEMDFGDTCLVKGEPHVGTEGYAHLHRWDNTLVKLVSEARGDDGDEQQQEEDSCSDSDYVDDDEEEPARLKKRAKVDEYGDSDSHGSNDCDESSISEEMSADDFSPIFDDDLGGDVAIGRARSSIIDSSSDSDSSDEESSSDESSSSSSSSD
jgi:hypothetical protein